MQFERRKFLRICAATLSLGALAPTAAAAMGATFIEYPERTAREFLKLHFAGSRTFSPSGLDRKERWFTRRFRQGLYKFFERQMKSGSSLQMVTDPFTGSQGASSYTVGKAKVRVEKAWVPVSFTDGRNEWTITYLMRNDQERSDDTWRIDDIQDVRGMLLTDALKKLK